MPYLSNNPGGVLFDTIKCNFRTNQIINLQNAGSVNTMYRMLYETKSEQQSVYSTNAISPLSIEDSAVTTGVIYDDYVAVGTKLGLAAPFTLNDNFSKHMIWALKNNQFNFDKQNRSRINIQVPVSLFYCDELLYFGNEKCELSFLISDTWYKDLILIAGSKGCNIPELVEGDGKGGRAYTVTNKTSNFEKCTFNVSCTGMSLFMCRGYLTKSNIPRSVSMTYYMKQFSPALTQLNQSSSSSLIATLESKCRMTHIVIGFLVNKSLEFKYSPCQFDSSYTDNSIKTIGPTFDETKNTQDPLTLIKNIRIVFASNSYPQDPYTLYFENGDNHQLFRGFTDYTIFSDNLRSGNGSLMDHSQWQNNQLYVFKLKHALNNTSGNISVLIDLKTTQILIHIVKL